MSTPKPLTTEDDKVLIEAKTPPRHSVTNLSIVESNSEASSSSETRYLPADHAASLPLTFLVVRTGIKRTNYGDEHVSILIC